MFRKLHAGEWSRAWEPARSQSSLAWVGGTSVSLAVRHCESMKAGRAESLP